MKPQSLVNIHSTMSAPCFARRANTMGCKNGLLAWFAHVPYNSIFSHTNFVCAGQGASNPYMSSPCMVLGSCKHLPSSIRYVEAFADSKRHTAGASNPYISSPCMVLGSCKHSPSSIRYVEAFADSKRHTAGRRSFDPTGRTGS